VRDFGGGGNCFFLSVAGILSELDGNIDETRATRDQLWVRNKMAERVNRGSTEEKNIWLAALETLRNRDPILKRFYTGVVTTNDLALRIKNAQPFSGVYQGDELSLSIAELAFDLTLAPIDIIRPKISDNLFKAPPQGDMIRNRIAFLRQTGGDASGHYQVHQLHTDSKDKNTNGTYLGFNLQDPDSIPEPAKALIDRYATQYNIDFRLIKSCRLKANTCSTYDTQKTLCENFSVEQIKPCLWTGAVNPRCEANAACERAGKEGTCEQLKDAFDEAVCELKDGYCIERRPPPAIGPVGCRRLENPIESTCGDVLLFTDTSDESVSTTTKQCFFVFGEPSSCAIKAGANPCTNPTQEICVRDPNCEWR